MQTGNFQMEPTSTVSLTYGLSKLWYFIGGLFGAGAVGAFWQPKALQGYGKFTKGLIIGGIGAVAPVMIGGTIARQMGLDAYSADVGMSIGTVVGISIIGVIGYAAKFFEKREGLDILQVAQEVEEVVRTRKVSAKPVGPTKTPVARKRVRAGTK
jgi:hypothetical protein